MIIASGYVKIEYCTTRLFKIKPLENSHTLDRPCKVLYDIFISSIALQVLPCSLVFICIWEEHGRPLAARSSQICVGVFQNTASHVRWRCCGTAILSVGLIAGIVDHSWLAMSMRIQWHESTSHIVAVWCHFCGGLEGEVHGLRLALVSSAMWHFFSDLNGI
jgi:hypothetical protein